MVDDNSNVIINFYTITSEFNDVIFRLCKKIIYSDENVYINFKKSGDKSAADKFLWTKEKKNFVPHKTYGEKITFRDKIVLFDGDYRKLSIIKRFKSLIVSPCVSIKRFDMFKKFLIFSYARDKKFNMNVKEKLNTKGFNTFWYNEVSPFKWKLE